MIGDKMQSALNEQIKEELESAYIYLSMAAYFHRKGMDGMASWMRNQTMEEMAHAMKLFDHIVERDGRVKLLPVNIKKTEWESPLEAFQDGYKHEQYITGKIHDLVSLAREERDFAADDLLRWFVDEQVEEEATASKIVGDLELVGDNGHALLMIDRELGQRTFTPPPGTFGTGGGE
jgi:ferritin